MDVVIQQSMARHQPAKSAGVGVSISIVAAIKPEMVLFELSGMTGRMVCGSFTKYSSSLRHPLRLNGPFQRGRCSSVQ